MRRTALFRILAVSASAALLPALASAQSYPARAIRIIVPAPPGGAIDIIARVVGEKLSASLGQPVVIDNKPGADGNLGVDAVAKAAPDGYTVVLTDISTLTISPLVMAKLPYDPAKDLAPITMVSFSAHALAVNPSVPAKTFPELIAYSKAHPGKVNFAAGNQVTRLIAEHLKKTSGIDMLSVPYKGGAAALNALIAGEVDVSLVGLLAALPHIQGGKVRAMATTGPARASVLPGIPTLSESGVAGFVSGSWQGLLAPAGTPPAVIAKLNAAVAAVLNEPALKARLAGQGTDVVGDSAEHFAAFLRADAATWKKVAQQAGIKPE